MIDLWLDYPLLVFLLDCYDQRKNFEDAEANAIGTEYLRAELLTAARAQSTPVIGLALAGMNDVLNSEGYTQAAWRNRIPAAAWILMLALATAGNGMIGYGSRKVGNERYLLTVLPIGVSVSFFLIADIDSPHNGVIHVHPQNLERLLASLPPP
jgi:hypothetical protein